AVLQPQRAEMAVGDGRVAAAELTRERRLRSQVLRPVEARDRGVELRLVARLELRDLEEHAVGDPRPEAGAGSRPPGAGGGEGDAAGALARAECAAGGELPDQEVGKAPRRAGEEAQLARAGAVGVQDRSSQVVFSSVYFSSACSDLSRPMPDCLKPPNGTVRS